MVRDMSRLVTVVQAACLCIVAGVVAAVIKVL